MTTIGFTKEKCAVCGHEAEFTYISSTNAFGSCDLDTRPPEMRRSTMDTWVQVCPECGYAADNLANKTFLARDYFESPEYRDFGELEPNSELAKSFIWKARVSALGGNSVKTFFDYIHAAWASDDMADEHWMCEARKLAIDAYDSILDENKKPEFKIIRADLLRRSGQFYRLEQEYESFKFKGKFKNKRFFNQILAFELELAKARDTACYTVADVPGVSEE